MLRSTKQLTVGTNRPRKVLRKTLMLVTSGGKYVVKSDDSGQYEMTNPAIDAPNDIICGAVPWGGSSGAFKVRCFPLTPNATQYTTRTGHQAKRSYLPSNPEENSINSSIRDPNIKRNGGARTHIFKTRYPQNETWTIKMKVFGIFLNIGNTHEKGYYRDYYDANVPTHSTSSGSSIICKFNRGTGQGLSPKNAVKDHKAKHCQRVQERRYSHPIISERVPGLAHLSQPKFGPKR